MTKPGSTGVSYESILSLLQLPKILGCMQILRVIKLDAVVVVLGLFKFNENIFFGRGQLVRMRSVRKTKNLQEMRNQQLPECYNILKTYDILYFMFLTPYRIIYRPESKTFQLLWRSKCVQVIVLCLQLFKTIKSFSLYLEFFLFFFAGLCALDTFHVLRALFRHICSKTGQSAKS